MHSSIFAIPRRVSRIQAFEEQGVSLIYPSRSWSGIRKSDGSVVIALREGEVQPFREGFRCLLWAPVIESATEWVDRPIKAERLEHCRVAAADGGADALIVRGSGAEVERGVTVGLRVELRRGEYWGYWGTASVGTAERASRWHGTAAAFEPALMAA